MRYLILSDIHANWEALQAVAEAASSDGYDEILCCGDIVGYGADPNPCVDWVRRNAKITVRGNHDKVAVGLEDLEWFNPAAQASAQWTSEALSAENQAWLQALPRGPIPVTDFQILHGSPADEDEYVIQLAEAAVAGPYLDTRVSFFGHTHIQGGFLYQRGVPRRIQPVGAGKDRLEYELDPDLFYLINPGSIGQPRDRDPRAAWAIYIPEARLVIYRRTTYDVRSAQHKIIAARLPNILAHRLAAGR